MRGGYSAIDKDRMEEKGWENEKGGLGGAKGRKKYAKRSQRWQSAV